ncbi:hypothetical protein AKJ36_02625 [candidate division MSBL1 archaeon SCGC-AAA259I07]|uniref:Uncharacterized protein n=1 Tax=candidate division MSBL1 archaeon SCGC-AAA259I07 TaxID=1698266 RepID=A0A133UK39_9EURY|nr:hypothetical protein AKJ36_02625 [candidate division MSBL1 archaeon SCGC-AAA259I07]
MVAVTTQFNNGSDEVSKKAGFPAELFEMETEKMALEDFLFTKFSRRKTCQFRKFIQRDNKECLLICSVRGHVREIRNTP